MNTTLKISLALILASITGLAATSYAQPGGPSEERLGKMLENQQKQRDDTLRKTLQKDTHRQPFQTLAFIRVHLRLILARGIALD